MGEEDKAQLLESYFWFGSAFRRAGPLRGERFCIPKSRVFGGVVGGEEVKRALEKKGLEFVVIGPMPTPGPVG